MEYVQYRDRERPRAGAIAMGLCTARDRSTASELVTRQSSAGSSPLHRPVFRDSRVSCQRVGKLLIFTCNPRHVPWCMQNPRVRVALRADSTRVCRDRGVMPMGFYNLQGVQLFK